MLVVFPFEEEYYRDRGVDAHYVGNPSVVLFPPPVPNDKEEVAQSLVDQRVPTVALLPGSRKKEVEQIFPIQLDAARHIAKRQKVQFWVIKAPEIDKKQLSEIYRQWIDRENCSLDLEIREEGISHLLPQVTCAVVKSGTSTLEASLLEIPFVMMYRISWPSWFLIRPRVSAETYCLANLIAEKSVVPEFIQQEATGQNIGDYILKILQDQECYSTIKKDLQLVSKKLGDHNAYECAASYVGKFLKNKGELVG
jgi:lipid-A-disaccharide synthase